MREDVGCLSVGVLFPGDARSIRFNSAPGELSRCVISGTSFLSLILPAKWGFSNETDLIRTSSQCYPLQPYEVADYKLGDEQWTCCKRNSLRYILLAIVHFHKSMTDFQD